MPNIPVRQLGQYGIIKDVSPFDLPVNAFSDGINVRFDNNEVQRAPIFRTVDSTLTGTVPVFCYGVYNPTGWDSILYANNDGRLFSIANGAETEVTPSGHTASVSTLPFTAVTLSECVYINRGDQQPYVMTPGASAFAPMTAWGTRAGATTPWTCNAIRAYQDFVFAIGTTEGGVSYPNRVRWSDQVLAGAQPDSWDDTDTTKLAGFNDLAQIKTPLVDGGPLGENFVLYSRDETWLVQYAGGEELFNWYRLPFDNAGIINANCWIEVNGQHYVWTLTDIYAHNGVQMSSIMDQRNRTTFFSELNISKSAVFFVAHDKFRHELRFCGVSGDADAAWPNPNGFCNYAAVYNYVKDTWSFVDLPNVSAASLANINTVYSYATVPSSYTYANMGGTYFDQSDSYSRYTIFTSVADTTNGLTPSKIYVLDGANQSKVALAIDQATVKPAWVQRIGLDLDNTGAELRGYKNARAVMPLLSIIDDVTMNVTMGAHLVSAAPVTWGPQQSFDPTQQYKIDIRGGGRFLAYEFEMPTANDFRVSGFDIDVVMTGKR